MNNTLNPEYAEELHSEVHKGKQAEDLINHPMWEEIDKVIREWAVEAMTENCHDKDVLYQISMVLKAHTKYQEILSSFFESGKVAKSVLDAIIDET